MKRFFSVLLCSAAILCSCTDRSGGSALLYVGTYGSSIHVFDYDLRTGELSGERLVPAQDASYIALSEGTGGYDKLMFAVSECGSLSGANSFARKDGEWLWTAHTSDIGDDPCHILPIQGTPFVATANYTGGSFSVFATEDGALASSVQREEFEGAHIHQIRELPRSICDCNGLEGRYVMVSDLGSDLVRVEKLGSQPVFVQVDSLVCPEGSGPRHMEFNEENSLLYCLTELSGEVIVWKISGGDGCPVFTRVQQLKADGFDAGGSADIHLHPCGKWLYTSHRLGGDGISVFKVGSDGLLKKAGYTATGIHPRNFTFSPDGRRLLVACRDSHCIQVFDINQQNGLLSGECREFNIGEDGPVCLVFE